MADNYVFKNLIWKFAGLNLILSAIGKWYTFQLLSGTLFDYHIHELKNYRISSGHKSAESDETQVRQSQCCDGIAGRIITN